ncbi:hypothetical protein SLS62_009926 [Diatrype stigma]|uniref:VWFA domain-containing protein n=1 Tax=Diatrype stigma TaxID=117547 RepID=A0AAN9YJI0_9PEZI
MTSQNTDEVAANSPVEGQDSVGIMSMNLRSAQSKDLEHADQISTAYASTNRQQIMELQRNKIVNRERDLDMQRIQLAEKLRDKLEECKMGEERLASIKSRNEALEAECATLHGQIDELAQRLEAQVVETGQRDEVMSATVRDLESRLEKAAKALEEDETKAKNKEQAMKELLSELDAAKQAIDILEITHESRERDLNQRLALKGTEAKKLKTEISNLQATCADAVSKKEAMQKELEKARDEYLAQSQSLQERLDTLQHAIKPFPQLIVIGVDVSGSVTPVLHRIKQAYRDVLHAIRSNNSDARVAVVIHGCHTIRQASPTQMITDATFRIMDSVNDARGSEDYRYCLEQADEILRMDDSSEKLIILIGDGQAYDIDETFVSATCEQLKVDRVTVHSIIITYHGMWLSDESTFREFSRITGGQTAQESTYLSTVDELLRVERERHFKAL